MISILKLLIIVVALVILLRFKVNLSLAIMGIVFITMGFFSIPLDKAFFESIDILTSAKTIQLVVIVIMVMFIGEVQKKKKMYDSLIRSLNHMFKDTRIVAMVVPSIIGFLPMPGGALLSAPLVDSSTKGMNISQEFKTFINYWFRHVWEFIWPIYAGLLLFQAMSSIPLKRIILFQSPFTLFNILAGVVITVLYFRKNNVEKNTVKTKSKIFEILKDFTNGVWPIAAVILLYFILSIPLYISLIAVVVVVIFVVGLSFEEVYKYLFNKSFFRIIFLISSVMIFQRIIKISNAFAMFNTMDLSLSLIILISFFVSFAMGFLTGVNTAFIAISYPILAPLIQGSSGELYISLYIYISGFAGILLSPTHLCLILTNEYFNSSLYKVYKYLLPPVLLLIAVSTILVFIFA